MGDTIDQGPATPGEKPKSAGKRRALPVLTQNRLFALLILIVTGAFVFSLMGLALLAILGKDPPTKLQDRFAEVCVYIAMVTIGTLVGLLGGRASAPDRLEIGDR